MHFWVTVSLFTLHVIYLLVLIPVLSSQIHISASAVLSILLRIWSYLTVSMTSFARWLVDWPRQ